MSEIVVRARILRLAPTIYICAGNVAGMNIRGGSRPDPATAVASFFAVLAGVSGNSDDAAIACAFLAAGTDMATAMGEIGAGDITDG